MASATVALFIAPLRLTLALLACVLGAVAARRTAANSPTDRWMTAGALALGLSLSALSLILYLKRPVDPRGVHTTRSVPGIVRAVVFSPDGRTAVSASDRLDINNVSGGEVNLWDPRTGAHRESLSGTSAEIAAVALAPDGRSLAVGSGMPLGQGEIRIWDLARHSVRLVLTGHRKYVQALAFMEDGQTLISGSLDRTVRLWNLKRGEPVRTLFLTGTINTIALSPDNRFLAVGTGAVDRALAVGQIVVYDLTTGKILWTQSAHSNGVLSLAYAPDGGTLASAGNDSAARLWDARTGTRKGGLEAGGYWLASVAFSPDGALLAAAGEDWKIRIWNARTLAATQTLTGHQGPIYSVAFAPDGGQLASGSGDGTLKFWDLRGSPAGRR